MKRIFFLLLVPIFGLSSCAGYKLGGMKPPSLNESGGRVFAGLLYLQDWQFRVDMEM